MKTANSFEKILVFFVTASMSCSLLLCWMATSARKPGVLFVCATLLVMAAAWVVQSYRLGFRESDITLSMWVVAYFQTNVLIAAVLIFFKFA